MKFFVVRNWRTGNLHTVKKEHGKVRVGWYVPSIKIDPGSLWQHEPTQITEADVESFKQRFREHIHGGYHRTTVLPDKPVEYVLKSERLREEANDLIAKSFGVPPMMIWGGAKGGGKRTRSQEIANRMRELSTNGNVYWAARDGTLEEYLASQPEPSKPKLDRRKKKRRK